MRAAGINVRMKSKGRPVVRLVIVSDAAGAAAIETSEVFTADLAELPEMLHDAGEAVRSRLSGLAVDRVYVRLADRAPVARNADGPRTRLLMEGAIIGAARSVIVETYSGDGKDCGRLFGGRKADVDADARALAAAHSLDADAFYEATAAGLTALAL